MGGLAVSMIAVCALLLEPTRGRHSSIVTPATSQHQRGNGRDGLSMARKLQVWQRGCLRRSGGRNEFRRRAPELHRPDPADIAGNNAVRSPSRTATSPKEALKSRVPPVGASVGPECTRSARGPGVPEPLIALVPHCPADSYTFKTKPDLSLSDDGRGLMQISRDAAACRRVVLPPNAPPTARRWAGPGTRTSLKTSTQTS